MRKITAEDVVGLSIQERIQLVEDIWDTIAQESNLVELTQQEKDIIIARLESYRKNPELGFAWADVYNRIVSGQ